jgi:type I restriction enzyme R subunit
MVEAKIAELIKRNPILQKIKSGDKITEEETEQLAVELHEEDPHITEQLLRKVYNHQKAKFIQFIKHILGIEILESFNEEVSRLVQEFIKEHSNLSTRQIEFLNLLKDYIIERGEIEKRDLISSPFTIIHPKGIRGVFTPSEIKEILALTEKYAA